MKFKQFIENFKSSSWLVALIMDGRVVDLNIVGGNNETALQNATRYVLPEYLAKIRPIIVAEADFEEPWRAHFDVDLMANGENEDRERFLKRWFPDFKW